MIYFPTMNDVFKRIESIGVLPVVKITSAGDSENLAASLLAGDLPAVEITFRTDAAAESIARIRKKFPDMLIGAGTVLTPDQVDSAVDAGAEFIVAPGFNPRIAVYCAKLEIPYIPGVNSPSQIELAMEHGLNVFKFFPAEAMGGIKMLKSLAGPYPGLRFIPTGGISPDNLLGYLSLPSVLACGGSWISPSAMIAEGRFDDIAKIASRTVSDILGFHLSGVSLGSTDQNAAEPVLDFFASTFLLNKNETANTFNAGAMIEIEKKKQNYSTGLILKVNSILRVKAFLDRKKVGYIQNEEKEIILDERKSGFVIKLRQE